MARAKGAVRAGVVGAGHMGAGFHADLLSHGRKFDLTAVCDTNDTLLAKAKRKFKVAAYSSLDELLARGETDLIVIATPTIYHAEQAMQALRAGKHVVIEAPMCMTIREADAVAATARQYRRILSVFHSHRWDADYVALQKAVGDQKLGAVFAVERRAYLAGDSWATSAAGNSKRPSWRLKREYGGGIGYDFGYHLIDQVLRLVPSDPEVIFGDAQARELTTEVDDHFMCAIRFRNRAMAVVETSACVRTPGASWLVVGTKGSIQGDDKKLKGKTGTGARQKDLALRMVKPDASDFYANLHKALTAGGELEVTPAEARLVVLVLEAAYRSSRVGCAVRLTGFE
jgi:scyllo-inositol 2-dehydrogenase (NADP+)